MAERMPPGPEHRRRQPVALGERMLAEFEQRPPLEPAHREQPACRQLGNDGGNADAGLVGKDIPVERDVTRLALVVELLANPRRDLLTISLVSIARSIRRWMEKISAELP